MSDPRNIITNITPPRVPLTDERTGLISREWYRFFLSLFTLTGGGQNFTSLTDLQVGPPTVQIEDVLIQLSESFSDAPTQESAIEQIAELQNQINGIMQSPHVELGTMASIQQNNIPWVTFDTTPEGVPTDVGTVAWDGGTTLGVQMTANVLGRINESGYYYIKASSAITKGQVIMFTGSVGASGVPTGAPATGVTDGTYIMGIAAENIANNGFGLIQFLGTLRGVNTSAFADGDVLWYNPAVTGGLTKTKPSAPNVKVQIAAVISATNNGTVLIRVNAGSVLGGTDSNVQFGTLANKDFIQYDSALQYWKNVAPGALTKTDDTNVTLTLGGTPSTALLAATSLTLGWTGQLSVARGGTGLSTTPTNGQLLIGNGTGYTVANLTAGTNISISNSAGGITINSSNPGGTVTSVGLSAPTGFSVSGSPVTSSGTLALSFATGYSLPTTASQTNWDTAYTERKQWDGGSTGLTASTGRTSLGATTVGSNLFTLTNPSAITFLRVNADNSVSTLDAATFRTAIGAGTGNGSVTSVSTGTGLTGGPITSSGTVSFSVAAVGTWAATPSSANLAAAMTDETGSGSLVFATSPTLTTPIVSTTMGVGGTTPASSGAGISFPATQSASSDANTLDDYEEGTFNCRYGAFSGVLGSFGQANCTYTKIGRHVFVSATISGTGMGITTVGYIQFTGMPFTASVNGAGSYGSTSISSQIAGTVVVTGTEFWLYASNSNNTTSSLWLSFSFPV